MAGKMEAPPSPVKKEEPKRPAEVRNTLGIGIYGNAVNPAGGGTLLLWPYEHVGLQASYTVGTFKTAEVRLLARFDPVWGARPYVGVGYMNVTKNSDVIGVSTEFKDSSISGVAGAEVSLGRRWFGYLEVSGASIDLQEIVTNGGQTAKATVDYAPVTIGVGIIYYLF
jgi:outer membrane protein W